MKTLYLKKQKANKFSLRFLTAILSLAIFFLIGFSAVSQSLGVSATGTPPDASAMLDVKSNDKGLLVPRLTTSERDAIQNPAMSLLIFNTESECFEAWNSNTSNWVSFGCIGCNLPTVPTANVGTNINSTDFDANWTASSGVTDYYIDVATDNTFTNFIINNQNVGNVTTYNVTGLTCETDYYYRVRAENICGTTISSNVEMVTAGSCCTNYTGATTFNYTGSAQMWTVPSDACNTLVTIEVWGAQGGNAKGNGTTTATNGLGGYAKGDKVVTNGDILYIYVGQKGGNGNGSGGSFGGWNGGGSGHVFIAPTYEGGGGGGASDVRHNGQTLNDRIIVGGGGGGNGTSNNSPGGNGGYTSGFQGINNGAYESVGSGTGGSQSAGGIGGSHGGVSGTFGIGGSDVTYCGGGGGGGWYGGGSGGNCNSGGGGGGSSYIGGMDSNTSTQNGTQTGNGKVTITW